jgi:hypothetical protein
VNGVLSEVRVVVFDAGAKPSFEGARRRPCTSASERRSGSSLAHTAERLAGLELDSRSLSSLVTEDGDEFTREVVRRNSLGASPTWSQLPRSAAAGAQGSVQPSQA